MAAKTVGRKAAANYIKGFSAVRPKSATTTARQAVRKTIKAGIRARRPGLAAPKVRARAAKQTSAFMRKAK